MHRAQSRRATMYAAVLITAALVAVIGVSGLTVTRIEFRATQDAGNVGCARILAQSAIELAANTIASDASWRTTYTNNVWSTSRALGAGTVAFKLVDELHGNLNADPSAPVRVYGRGGASDAVRIYSVLLELPDKAEVNVITNGDIETGVAGWARNGCKLAMEQTDVYEGSASLHVTTRSDPLDGPQQDVYKELENGLEYTAVAWLKSPAGQDMFRIHLTCETNAGNTYESATGWHTVGTSWTEISETLIPTWSGTLTSAMWSIETYSYANDFLVDDAGLINEQVAQSFRIHPESWRQETDP